MERVEFELLKLKIRHGPLSIRIISDSMAPLFNAQDTVDAHLPPRQLNPFDLLVFYERQRLVCHFVWKDQQEFDGTVLTRSLKNPYVNDLPHTSSDILGWVPSKNISFLCKYKILILNLARGTL